MIDNNRPPAPPSGSPRHCLVCLERHADVNAPPSPLCSSGCRGRAAVCEECYSRLRKCVFCRARIRYNSFEEMMEEREAQASRELQIRRRHMVAMIMTMGSIFTLIFLTIRYNAERDHETAEDAFGSPVPFDVNGLD